jgi:putative OPT family oligopeptide transporter
VITGNIDWSLIAIGGGIGVVLIVVDEVLARTGTSVRMPPLAVGLGIYLPTSTTLMVVVGALVGAWFDRRAERGANAEATKQLGILLASGLIVGESLLGVIVAAAVALSGNQSPLAVVGDSFATPAIWIGGLAFTATVVVMYRWIARMGQGR